MTKNVWISLLIRLMLGLVFLAHGLEKLIEYRDTVETMAETFDETWLPMVIVYGFLYILPFIETAIGISYLMGFKYRATLVATAILLAILTFGLAVRGDYEPVSRNLVYFFILIIGLWQSDENRFCVSKSSIKD
ncbi:MAG: DoxX family protein [Candidatus Zixiibacteriota bacterium]